MEQTGPFSTSLVSWLYCVWANGVPPSPQGGVFAACGDWGNESFYADFNGLEVGTPYTVVFWQISAGLNYADGNDIGDTNYWVKYFIIWITDIEIKVVNTYFLAFANTHRRG